MSETIQKFSSLIQEMEAAILENLSDLEKGYGKRKSAISDETGIPLDILTVLLKRLKINGKIELIVIWSEWTCAPNGSGYCLAGKMN